MVSFYFSGIAEAWVTATAAVVHPVHGSAPQLFLRRASLTLDTSAPGSTLFLMGKRQVPRFVKRSNENKCSSYQKEKLLPYQMFLLHCFLKQEYVSLVLYYSCTMTSLWIRVPPLSEGLPTSVDLSKPLLVFPFQAHLPVIQTPIANPNVRPSLPSLSNQAMVFARVWS